MSAPAVRPRVPQLNAEELRELCLECGADDAGFVEIDRPALAGERDAILQVYPRTRSVISLVSRVNPEALQSPARYVANEESHRTGKEISHIVVAIVRRLNERGVRGLAVPIGFPMNMNRWPGKIWDVSQKPIAVQAGLGQMGINRNVIHPRFGNHVLLDSILIDAEIDAYGEPIDYNPCFECNLCVAACPVGAIGRDGSFDFLACMTHNYHDFLGGFVRFVDEIVESESVEAYRARHSDSDSAGWWQSLGFGPNYKAGYCWAVCPAGGQLFDRYQANPKDYVDSVVRPLRELPEPVYVIEGSRAERVAQRRHGKQVRTVASPIRGATSLPRPVGEVDRSLPGTSETE